MAHRAFPPVFTTVFTTALPVRVVLLGAVLACVATVLPATAAEARPWPGHPDRRIVVHTVRPGETATGLSVRYHAWTREFVALNGHQLRVGERVRVPVVVSAARKARAARHKAVKQRPRVEHRVRDKRWTGTGLSRQQVRRLVVRTAKRLDVPPRLALAIAWQESGWQQHRVSSTGALGVMQVMPDTGRWMRLYVGRKLRLRDVDDNVLAGVMTLKVLRVHTRRDKHAIAAYYQGLGAVRKHGLFKDTRHYVRAVRAHERRIQRVGSPV